jgi:hypothetical protein
MSGTIVVPRSAHPMLEGCLALMDGRIQPKHPQDRRSADQLIERVVWPAPEGTDAEQQVATDRRRRFGRRMK